MKIRKVKYCTLIFVLVLFLGGFACKENPPALDPPNFQVLAADIGVTEVWLHVISVQTAGPKTLTLVRDADTILITQFSGLDTILYDGSLLPKHSYVYNTTVSSTMPFLRGTAELALTTMDTTSHSFTWQIDTLGDGNGSVLYDVAIINDTLTYAVGEMYLKNISGQFDPTMYNLARWNGSQWKLDRVYYISQGQPYPGQLYAIFAFGENDIWVGGTQPQHWNGRYWEQFNLPASIFPAYINKIWGTSSSNLYIVGTNGSIAHYNGIMWKKIESGTELALADIYGSPDFVVVAGVNMSTIKGIILKNNGTGWQTIGEGEIIASNELFKPKLYGSITSAWKDEKNTIYAGGNLFYKYQFGQWNYMRSLPENYIGGNPNVYYRGFIYKIRGNNSNDFWIVGDRNTIRHFNGVWWKQVGLPYDPISDIIWRSVDVKNDFCVTVGDGTNRGICIRIKR